MNSFIRVAIVLLLACGLAAVGSAFKVESAEVSPDGVLQAGVRQYVFFIVSLLGSVALLVTAVVGRGNWGV